MGWQFQTVIVTFMGGLPGERNPLNPSLATFAARDKVLEIRTAECALKSFHIGYTESDHNFYFQRIAIRDVKIVGSTVNFIVETALNDDTDDLNTYSGEVEVLVIADVHEKHVA